MITVHHQGMRWQNGTLVPADQTEAGVQATMAYAILKAHNDFRTMRKRYTSHPDIDLLDQRSDTHRNIIVDYYLRGRKTWK